MYDYYCVNSEKKLEEWEMELVLIDNYDNYEIVCNCCNEITDEKLREDWIDFK